MGGSINFTGTTGNPTLNFSVTTAIFGSFTLAVGMIVSGTSNLFFEGRGNYTINTNGVVFSNPIIIDCGSQITNSYTLNNNLTINNNLYPNSGTFNANGFNVTAYSFSLSPQGYLGGQTGPRTCNMGSGIWTLQTTLTSINNWNLTAQNAGFTLNSQTSTLNLNNPVSATFNFLGGNYTYYNVNFSLINGSEGSFKIMGNNTFQNLTINSPNNVFFTNGSTTTCQQFNCNGTVSGVIVLRSTINNYQWYLNVLQGYTCSNTDIRDSNAAGSLIQP
jgi:hypothetical protein